MGHAVGETLRVLRGAGVIDSSLFLLLFPYFSSSFSSSQDGSFHSAVYCLRALSLLARFFPHVIFDYGGVALGMWHICKSKSEDLLEAAIGAFAAGGAVRRRRRRVLA